MLNTLKVEQFRLTRGPYGSDASYGANGVFYVKHQGKALKVVISDELGWEHVSVSSTKIPTWGDMCFVKDLFWEDEDTVVQYHPAKSEYVNYHPNCLHLWRCTITTIPVPPSFMVGPK